MLIPEDYVADLNVRMSLYRRLAGIERTRTSTFAAELIDRFGPLPDEVKHLFEIVTIKELAAGRGGEDRCRAQGRAHLPRQQLRQSGRLIQFINQQGASAKVRPDQKVVVFYDWEKPAQRLHGTTAVLRNLVRIAGLAKAA